MMRYFVEKKGKDNCEEDEDDKDFVNFCEIFWNFGCFLSFLRDFCVNE